MEIAMYVVWGVIILVSIFVEINTQMQIGLGSVFGATAAIITHALVGEQGLWVEFLVFFVTWVIFWLLFFGVFSYLKPKNQDREDGYMKFINKEAQIYKTNKGNEFGEIKINDIIFRFKNEEAFKKGDKVIIKKIKGVTCEIERK